MDEEERSPAGQDGAERKLNDESEALRTTTPPLPQGQKTNGQPIALACEVQTELGVILTDIAYVFSIHLSLPTGAAEAIALWVISAHTLDCAEFSPRLVFQSPVPECGKSTALELLIGLLPNPMPTSNATPAVIYRSIEYGFPTLIIDEADTFMDNTDRLTGILNSGHKRATAHVHRCVGDDHKVKAFPTFCPMVIARIGELPPALESRSIVIRMQRAKPNEGISRFTSADRAELQKIKVRIEKWLLTGEHKKLKDANPTIPATNRLADNWRHLIAIADLAGGEWPLARKIIGKLMPKKEEVGGVLLLRAIKQVFDTTSHQPSCAALSVGHPRTIGSGSRKV